MEPRGDRHVPLPSLSSDPNAWSAHPRHTPQHVRKACAIDDVSLARKDTAPCSPSYVMSNEPMATILTVDDSASIRQMVSFTSCKYSTGDFVAK